MATFNLIRNSRVFFTTNVNATTGVVQPTGFTGANTQEITVLDGFSFSQTTNADVITVSEAGSAPSRGQRSFNTALNPVDFSFSTYLKPVLQDTVRAEESHLWNALFGTTAVEDKGVPLTWTTAGTIIYNAPTSTAAANLVITATGISTSLVVGDYVTLRGATGDKANELNTAYKISAKTTAAVTLQFATVPESLVDATSYATAFSTTSTAATPALWLTKTSWLGYPAISADTSGTVVGVNKVAGASYAEVSTVRSNANQLLAFGMIIVVDGITYTIDNCALDQATIDFGLDGIATVQWTGKGTALNQAATTIGIGSTAATSGFINATVATTTASTTVTFGSNVTLKANSVLRYKGEVIGILSGDVTTATTGTLAAAATRTISALANEVYASVPVQFTSGVLGTSTTTVSGYAAPKIAGAQYITNKLSTATLTQAFGGGGSAYTVALTGGSIQIANNIGYVTPANIGIVNSPIGYYTGTRSITGTLNAYLRTGTGSTSSLLAALLANVSTATETKYELGIQIGGASNSVRVELFAGGTSVQIPTIDAQAVLSTAINFTVQGFEGFTSANSNFDLEAVNDMRVRYFGV